MSSHSDFQLSFSELMDSYPPTESDMAALLQEIGDLNLPVLVLERELLEKVPVEASVYSPPLPQPYPALSSQRKLNPLSSGGYIYNCPPTPHPANVPHAPVKLEDAIPADLSRKEKLEKYRQKRAKRNFSRPVDEGRRERALARSRDEFGHFQRSPQQEKLLDEIARLREQLYVSHTQSYLLNEKLRIMESELAVLNSRVPEMPPARDIPLMWPTVPAKEVFNTIRPDFPYSEPFKEKVDLTGVELQYTDSPYVVAPGSSEDLDLLDITED